MCVPRAGGAARRCLHGLLPGCGGRREAARLRRAGDGRCSAAAAAPLTGGLRSGGGAQRRDGSPAGRPRPPPAAMASEVVCGLTFRLLLPVCLTAGTSLPPSLPPFVGPGAVGPLSLPAGAGGLGDAPLSFPRGISPFPLFLPRNFKLRNSPLISYVFVVVNFCRRWCAGLRGFSLGTAAAGSRVPHRPASSGTASERRIQGLPSRRAGSALLGCGGTS